MSAQEKHRFDVFAFVSGVSFIVVGVLFLLDQADRISIDVGLLLPILLVVGGGAAAVNSFRRRE